jgi:signal transduction histidine kinase
MRAQQAYAADLEAAVSTQLGEIAESRKRVLNATVEERRRISRDLHDGLQGHLMAVNVILNSAKFHATDPAGVEAIDKARALVSEAASQLREMALAIYPNNLDVLGLQGAIRTLVERLDVTVALNVDDAKLPPDLERELYFLVSEAITNTMKHAQARHIGIDLTASAGRVRVEITDDGVGGADPSGPGLTGLAQRVAGLGGELSIVSPSDKGTKILASIPCK